MDPLDLNTRTFPSVADSQVKYTGPSVPALGIKQGDSISKVLSVIAENLQPNLDLKDLEDRMNNLTADDLMTTAPTLDLGGQSSASAAKIFNKGFNYTVSQDGNYTSIQYSMKDTTDNIPDGFRVISSGLSVQGAQSRSLLNSTSGSSGVVKILPTQFPVLLNFRVGINTPDGDIKLTRTQALQAPSSASNSGSLILEDLTTPADGFLKQKEMNTRLVSELSRLKQRVADLERNQNGT